MPDKMKTSTYSHVEEGMELKDQHLMNNKQQGW
jgi:hypothetical protein